MMRLFKINIEEIFEKESQRMAVSKFTNNSCNKVSTADRHYEEHSILLYNYGDLYIEVFMLTEYRML